ncbi:NAD-dependent protein deacylase [Pseudoramibacter faecis]|uniref:NAD-dependent protein deacylase n=1 Tax=Pseudoramibacter faecis TaxID=3108534 RepID=UPI002E760607|nr:NAD-dependent protein deacylase [Pseudoramibacter sp. HA2172]
MPKEVEQLTDILKASDNIVFFGGAGVSTASGIPDFRSAGGIYSQRLHAEFSPEEMVSHSFFVNHPEDFFDFYRNKMIYPDAEPNGCHKALAKLEQMGKLKAVVTQNIDGLHQKAGSEIVFELHGSVLRNYCTHCHAFYDDKWIMAQTGVPKCEKCGATVKPDVVLYEEALDSAQINGAVAAIEKADTLIVGGTSLIVYPAAGLIHYFRGRHLVEINKSATAADNAAELVIRDDIAKVMDEAVADL